MKVMHVISGLGLGGAETQLSLLAASMIEFGHDVQVVSLLPGGENAKKLAAKGIDVQDLGMRRGIPNPIAVARFHKKVNSFKPDIIQSWLYHADLLSLINSILHPEIPTVWNIRCSELAIKDHGLLLFAVIRSLGFFSKRPAAIVANSHAGKDFHAGMGYHPKKWEIIPNGIDTEAFKPDENARKSVRDELGLPKDTTLIGHVARYHPMKDHESLVLAAAQVINNQKNAHFVLVGPDVDSNNSILKKAIANTGFSSNFHLLGGRADVCRLQAAWDLAVCSSYSEGFPNTLAEAMSCETPCVGTDTGDIRQLLGNTGEVVATKNPDDLARGIIKMLSLPLAQRKVLGRKAREKVLAEFSLQKCTNQYISLYSNCIHNSN